MLELWVLREELGCCNQRHQSTGDYTKGRCLQDLFGFRICLVSGSVWFQDLRFYHLPCKGAWSVRCATGTRQRACITLKIRLEGAFEVKYGPEEQV